MFLSNIFLFLSLVNVNIVHFFLYFFPGFFWQGKSNFIYFILSILSGLPIPQYTWLVPGNYPISLVLSVGLPKAQLLKLLFFLLQPETSLTKRAPYYSSPLHLLFYIIFISNQNDVLASTPLILRPTLVSSYLVQLPSTIDFFPWSNIPNVYVSYQQ